MDFCDWCEDSSTSDSDPATLCQLIARLVAEASALGWDDGVPCDPEDEVEPPRDRKEKS